MSIKAQLTAAVDAHIAGNADGAREALRHAIISKRQRMTEAVNAQTWEASVDDWGIVITIPQQIDNIPAGDYMVQQVDVEYTVYGKYYPATRFEPAEYPELEVLGIAGLRIVQANEDGEELAAPIDTANPQVVALLPEEVVEQLGEALQEHFNDDTGPFAPEEPDFY